MHDAMRAAALMMVTVAVVVLRMCICPLLYVLCEFFGAPCSRSASWEIERGEWFRSFFFVIFHFDRIRAFNPLTPIIARRRWSRWNFFQIYLGKKNVLPLQVVPIIQIFDKVRNYDMQISIFSRSPIKTRSWKNHFSPSGLYKSELNDSTRFLSVGVNGLMGIIHFANKKQKSSA